LVELGWQVEELLVVPEHRHGDPDVACDFPDPTAFDLLVPLGAPWSVYDEPRIGTWITAEIAWLTDAVARDVPVLGICFGAQALARALGGEVRSAQRGEIGWVTIDSDVPDLVGQGPWFQWHRDVFTVPDRARVLARTAVGPQAFRVGRSLALQFHPELTPPVLEQWLDNNGYADAVAFGLDPDLLRSSTRASAQQARERASVLVDAYLRDVFARDALAEGNIPAAAVT
jgi:GMP synthase-like glutamine amidotransferase